MWWVLAWCVLASGSVVVGFVSGWYWCGYEVRARERADLENEKRRQGSVGFRPPGEGG